MASIGLKIGISQMYKNLPSFNCIFFCFVVTTSYLLQMSNMTLQKDTLCGNHGVICDREGKITQLLLSANNLTGTLPTEIRMLQSVCKANIFHSACTCAFFFLCFL